MQGGHETSGNNVLEDDGDVLQWHFHYCRLPYGLIHIRITRGTRKLVHFLLWNYTSAYLFLNNYYSSRRITTGSQKSL